MKLLNLHPFWKGIILFVVILFIFLLYRGCQYANHRAAKYSVYEQKIDSLLKKQVADSISSRQNADNFNASLEYSNGVIALKDNQLQATRTDLEAANIRIDALLKKHKPVQPDTNSTVTTVPNEYIEECAECFAELEYHKGKSSRFIKEADSLHAAHLAKESLQQKRIKQLEQEKSDVSETLTDCLTAAKAQSDKLEIRRKMYLTMGAIWAHMPKAVGIGLAYSDKRGRMFSAKVYGGEWGRMYGTDVIFPLSFRRK